MVIFIVYGVEEERHSSGLYIFQESRHGDFLQVVGCFHFTASNGGRQAGVEEDIVTPKAGRRYEIIFHRMRPCREVLEN